MRVSGSENVAGVMGDALRSLYAQRDPSGTPSTGVDNISAATSMSQAMGLTQPADGSVPVRENLARFGLFLDQAARMGISRIKQNRRLVK